MSHPLYNPCASGNQSSTQGQYGLSSGQPEKDPQRASSSSGPGFSFSFSGTSSGTSANSGGIIPSQLPQSMSYGPEQSRAILDENMERSIDMHISRASKGVRLLGKPMQQPIDSRLTRIQRECLSSGTGMVSYPTSSTSASLGRRYPGVESGSSSLDWSSNYKRPTADEPSRFYSSSASSSFARSGDSVLIASSEREHVMQSLPGLGHFEYPLADKPILSDRLAESESASNILLRFGLEKEDLDHLANYPEDQITPANMPFILRQIRLEKTKRATTAVQSKPCSEPQPSRMSHSGMSHSGGAGMRQEEITSAVLEQSNVIDCGHTDKYTKGAGEEIGSISRSRENCGGSGSMLLIYTYGSSRHIEEPPQKNTTQVKSTALGFSRNQASSVSSLSSLYSSKLSSVAPPSNDPTKLQIQPNHSSQTILSSSSLPKTDTDIRVDKSEASKPDALKEPEADRQSTTKTQPPCTLHCGVHPSRPDPVLIGSNDTSGNKDQNNSKAQGSIAEKIKKQQPKSQMQQKQKQQTEKQPVSQTGQAILPSVFSATESVPPTPHIPSITGAMQHLPFIPVGPPPIVSPPALPQPIPDLVEIIDLTLSPSNTQPPTKVSVSKDLPTAAMMRDGAAATPRVFPHTCCLCNKECLNMKDWVYHHNTSFHLECCKVLRKRYPEWDGEIPSRTSAAGKDAKTSPSTSSQTSRHRQKTWSRSRSRSRSHSRSPIPRQHHRSEGRREKPSSQSRSPHRYSRRSRSGSRPTSSRYRSRSKSSERQPSQRRRDEKRSSPKRSCKRRSSPRKTDERRLPRRRSDQRPSARRERLRSKERLAEKLLENSAVHLLSNQSDLEALVKSLAPIILAELAKRKSPSPPPSSSSSSSSSPHPSPSSSSSSSSSSSNEGKTTLSSSASSSSSSSTAKKELIKKPSEAKPSLQKSEASSSTKTKCGKPSPPTMVKLKGIHSSVSRSDVLAALERFGKTKSFLLFPSKLEAIVCFEKEEDAKQMKCQTSLDVKGIQITVVGGKDTVCVEQKKPPLKKPSTSSVSTPLNTSTITGKILLPTPDMIPLELPKTPPSSPSGPERDTPGKLQKSAAEAENSSAKQDNEMPQVFQTVTSITPLTVGETIEKHLRRDRIKLFDTESILWEKTIEYFENEEDAEKLKSLTSVGVEGIQITVVGGKKTVCVEQKKPPLKKPSTSSVSTPLVTSTITRKVLLPTPDMIPLELPKTPRSSPSGAQRATTENEMPQVFHVSIRSPAEYDEPMEIGEMGAEVVEPIEVGTLSTAQRPGTKTVGENIAKHLHQDRIQLFEKEEHVPGKIKLLLITNLPEYRDGCYTEEDLVKLLTPFGFKYAEDSIYVIPQKCMAFFMVPTAAMRLNIMEASATKGIYFKSSKLAFNAVVSRISMTPIGFYKSLMKLMSFNVLDDGGRIVFIKNISLSDSRELREVFKRVVSVKNFLPLLNKVFVEFKSIRDADRLGVWYSLLKQAPDHKVYRLKIPSIGLKLPRPRTLPENALPDSKDVVAGATIPPIEIGVPQGSIGPFWIPMRTHPFLFPTGSPCFFIPDYLTVRGQDDIAKASGRGARFPTIMLTGLPAGNYVHEDVAKLVWQYFPKRNLRSLFYNVAVLPLQRRAFVFFADWTSCCNFVQDHITSPVCVDFFPLWVHFVLEDISPVSSEEMMYTTLMKWSNTGVPDPKLLEERLLCVETSEMSLDVIEMVMGVVASIAPFVGFLPLANRICIEMADSSGVTKVVEKRRNSRIFIDIDFWDEVRSFEPLKSLKQRLQDSDEVTINFEPDTVKLPALKSQIFVV